MAKKATKTKENKIIDMSIFCSAKQALEREKTKTVLPVSPSVDLRLGGGIIEGSLVLIRGMAKCGKSLTCMEIAVNALKQGRKVLYFDTECRLTASKYLVVGDFDLQEHPNFFLFNSESGQIENGVMKFIGGEKMYSQIIAMMKMSKYKGAVYIIDSISCVLTQDVLDDPEVRADRRDPSGKLNADFCKKVGPYIRMSNSIVVGIQHLAVDMSPMGHGALKPIGGDRLNYSCDIVLDSRHSPMDLDGSTVAGGFEKGKDAISGILIRYNLPVNKLLGPYVAKEKEEKIQNYYIFGHGCWKGKELLTVLDELGLINKSGSWISFITEKITDRVQGSDKAAKIVEDNLEYFEQIVKDYYMETYGINYNFVSSQEESDEDSDD